MPTQPPRGEARTRAPHVMHQRWHQRRLRLAQVHSSVQRCRMVTETGSVWGKRASGLSACHAAGPGRARHGRLFPANPVCGTGSV